MPDARRNLGPDGNHSHLSGGAGDVVQARDISGGVHFHYGPGSRGAPPQQLPRGIRIFINRLADLGRLDELIAGGQADGDAAVACVITGTAGVGKTSLALHWAHRVREQFPDGQLYIDLRGYDPGPPVTPDQALEQFLLALGVPATVIPNDVEIKSSLYRSILADRQMLVILDNAGTVGQVRPLMPGTSRSLVIVTSRSRLSGLIVRDGAHRTTLETLTESESVELLAATTADYRSGDQPAEIAELARLCAYLPLALRIAAERAASRPAMPLSELIADLRDESELWSALSTGDEGEADAVRTVFAWSYRALPEGAARLFCLLGLHPGSEFSQTAAAVLAGNEAVRVRSSLDVLTGAYLLESKGSGRYRFHDLLRAYAVDRARYEVSQAEQLAAVERACSWYLHSAHRCALALAHDTTLLFTLDASPQFVPLTFEDHVEAAQWYETERSNLVGAVRAAFGTRLLRLTWQLAVVTERIYSSYNHFQDWRTTSLIGLQAARELGRREEAVMCESLGRLCRMTLELDKAAEYHRNAIAIHRELGDLPSAVKALNGLAWVHLFAHRLQDARATLEDALSMARLVGDDYWIATIHYSLGYSHLQLEQPGEASVHLEESLNTFRALGDRLYESMVLTAFSLMYRDRGETERALATAHEAVEISHEMANKLWEGTALLYLGKAQRATGRADEALVSYQHAAVSFRQEGDLSREAMALDGTGLAYMDLARPSDAVDFHRHAASMHRQVSDRWKLARSLGHLSDALRALKSHDEADRHRQEAVLLLAGFTDTRSESLRARLDAATGGSV
ncbi:ATP-binding protein [Streptosporangium sp. NPDC002721]|uniref:ATP-binding protein n=1 Tax=Streptosporangium sp. NPDC002721 TaxID=3366188 RepID=UPI00369AAFDE